MKRKFAVIDTGSNGTARKVLKRNTPMLVAYDRKKAVSSSNQQAMRVGGWANPSRGGELKFIDTQFTTDPTAASTAFTAGTLLNGIANGSDASSRIGRKCTIKSLLVRWSCELRSTSTVGGNIRILIVYDKQANATAPVITDILLADAFNSPNNLSNRDRFVTLCDYMSESISINGNATVANVIYKSLNLEEMFNAGSAGTIGDITSGSIYMFVAQSGGIATTAPDMLARCRVRYTDV